MRRLTTAPFRRWAAVADEWDARRLVRRRRRTRKSSSTSRSKATTAIACWADTKPAYCERSFAGSGDADASAPNSAICSQAGGWLDEDHYRGRSTAPVAVRRRQEVI